MPRWLLFTLFALVAVAIISGVHIYLYFKLALAPALPRPWRAVARTTLIVLAASIPLLMIASQLVDSSVARYAAFPVFVWLGLMMMLFFLFLFVDIIHGLSWLVAKISGHQDLLPDPRRRQFLSRVIAGAATGTVVTAALPGIAHGLGKLVVRRVEVALPRLPAALDGFTIAQLTDLHVGPMRGRSWVEEVVAKTNAVKPDLVAITGNLVDGSVKQLAKDVAPLASLKAPHGVFFVTGNHEYFRDLNGWLEHLPELGMRVLRNERVTIRRGGGAFDLAGVDDHDGARFAPGHGPDVAKAMKGRDASRASVLLAHQPRVIEQARAHGAGLVLAGHTHGGQIWPWRYLVYLQQPYVSGLHDHQGTMIYVSQGTGFWGPPIRLGTTAEESRW